VPVRDRPNRELGNRQNYCTRGFESRSSVRVVHQTGVQDKVGESATLTDWAMLENGENLLAPALQAFWLKRGKKTLLWKLLWTTSTSFHTLDERATPHQ